MGSPRSIARLSTSPSSRHSTTRQVASHHQATYLFRVTVRDLATAGEIVEAASTDQALGDVMRVQHIEMSFSDPERLLTEARARAVAAARLAVAMDIRSWSAVRLLPFVIFANASGLLMLLRARRSIVAAWSRP